MMSAIPVLMATGVTGVLIALAVVAAYWHDTAVARAEENYSLRGDLAVRDDILKRVYPLTEKTFFSMDDVSDPRFTGRLRGWETQRNQQAENLRVALQQVPPVDAADEQERTIRGMSVADAVPHLKDLPSQYMHTPLVKGRIE